MQIFEDGESPKRRLFVTMQGICSIEGGGVGRALQKIT